MQAFRCHKATMNKKGAPALYDSAHSCTFASSSQLGKIYILSIAAECQSVNQSLGLGW